MPTTKNEFAQTKEDRLRQKDALSFMIQSKEQELSAKKQDLGKVGAVFGSRANAALYLAGAVALLALVGAGILGVVDPTFRPDLMKLLAAAAMAALGFVGGVLTK